MLDTWILEHGISASSQEVKIKYNQPIFICQENTKLNRGKLAKLINFSG